MQVLTAGQVLVDRRVLTRQADDQPQVLSIADDVKSGNGHVRYLV